MKAAVDENIPLSVVRELRNRDWDILDIRGTSEEGMRDSHFWERVQSEERLFITTDKGFSQYRDASHHGLIIISLKHPNSQKIFTRAFQALDQFDEWTNRMVIMRDTVQSVWISHE